jgi:FtsP/CotA-like multicopper oxidase with cupredoxin domain
MMEKQNKAGHMKEAINHLLSRRSFLGASLGGAASVVGAGVLSRATPSQQEPPDPHNGHASMSHDGMSMGLVGEVDHERNGFDPMQMLVDWDYGTVSTTPDGQTVREYDISAGDIEIEIAPGVFFPAWTFNGRVPGPAIRCTEGDLIRINFANFGSHPHTMHFHGFHPAEMDGVPGVGAGEIVPGASTVYEFNAEPFGCHLYHCHAIPLKRHIHKGLYGAFVIDPPEGRTPAREFMMIMNGFDTNFDGGNEIYAVNTVGHEFMRRPIPVIVGETIRIYLINMVEFDLINSFHVHATFFDYYDHGTTLEPTSRTIDTVIQAQGQRGILEFNFRWAGQYMFHAHISEFAELGWMGFFNAVQPEDYAAALAQVGLDDEWDRKALNGSTVQTSEEA